MDHQPKGLYDSVAKRFLRERRPIQERAVLACETDQCEESCWEMYVCSVASLQDDRVQGISDMTSEEVREKRRAERKQFKLDRAAAIAKAAAEAEAAFAEGREAAPAFIPSGATWKPQQPSEASALPEEPPEDEKDGLEDELEPLEDMEHLQLTLQEAFFLAWNLDCLTVLDPHTVHVIVVQRNTQWFSDYALLALKHDRTKP